MGFPADLHPRRYPFEYGRLKAAARPKERLFPGSQAGLAVYGLSSGKVKLLGYERLFSFCACAGISEADCYSEFISFSFNFRRIGVSFA
jgi:hypothetical protein